MSTVVVFESMFGNTMDVARAVERGLARGHGDVLRHRRVAGTGRLGVGLDNIDLPGCEARGIRVIPGSGANALAVAEYVIGAAMVLLRGVDEKGFSFFTNYNSAKGRDLATPIRKARHGDASGGRGAAWLWEK